KKEEDKKETPSHSEGEQAHMVTEEHKEEKVTEEEPKVTQPKPIHTIITTTPYPTTLITLEAQVTELTAHLVPEVGGSSLTPRVDKGRGIATQTDLSPLKFVKASREVCPDLDAQGLLDKKEQIEQAVRRSKVAEKVVNKAKVQIKGSKDFINHQDAHFKVLTRAYNKKLKNNDPRNFDVHKNFKFGYFGISEWDELSVIIPKKKNKVLPEGLKFENNLVIEDPEHGLFFIDAFRDEAFQRVNDVHKVNTESLFGYKVMASNVNSDAN
ncbi:hypothetical protein Tco_1412517, partial [Tanacetum coccineum]